MKKKIWIGVALVFGLAIGYVGYLMLTTRNHSPLATANYSKSDLNIAVTYCRPSKKGRVVFGEESAGALQPNGKYWRVGANEATQIKFSKDVMFGDKQIKAGEYVLYAIPSSSDWTIALNSDLGRWGASEADKDLDVARISVPSKPLTEQMEQFTIDFVEADSMIQMQLKWDQTLVAVPITGVN